MGELSELKECRAGWQKRRQNWPVSSEKPEDGGVVHTAQGWAGRLLQVCGRRDWCRDVHYVIYMSERAYITCPVSVTLALYWEQAELEPQVTDVNLPRGGLWDVYSSKALLCSAVCLSAVPEVQ